VVAARVRRAGLSPSATSIIVLTATAVSMIAGKAHAVSALYPMASMRSRSARKLTANAPAPMAVVAPTARATYGADWLDETGDGTTWAGTAAAPPRAPKLSCRVAGSRRHR
jgi:hypothetical protein